ncbi:hypothetical protein M5689_023850 [Euphorbia peplus]|nr:hypothetical protein M5689_023850 [Euphorbia peplus]
MCFRFCYSFLICCIPPFLLETRMECVFQKEVGFLHSHLRGNHQKRRLALAGEASQECLHLWELLECSICDPGVGVQPGPPLLCSSFCDRVYQACSNAYFSMDAKTRALVPCGANEFVCEEASCYGGKASLDAVAESWKGSRTEFPLKDGKLGDVEDFLQWVQERPFNEKVSWAVGGMVLTAGLLFLSKRKSYSQRQKLAAIQRTARKMEGKFNQRYPDNQAIKKRK